MTNLDKYKKSLTAETLADIIAHNCDMGITCPLCPCPAFEEWNCIEKLTEYFNQPSGA